MGSAEYQVVFFRASRRVWLGLHGSDCCHTRKLVPASILPPRASTSITSREQTYLFVGPGLRLLKPRELLIEKAAALLGLTPR